MVYRDVRESVSFRFGEAAVCDLMDGVQQLRAHFLVGLLAAYDGAEIHVHVVLHALVGATVCRDLEDGDNGIACGCAAAGGENDYLAAPRYHGGNGRNIVTRGVHDDSAVLCRALCLLKHFHDGTGTALADAAEALFVQGAQAARLVARCGLTGAAVLPGGLEVILISAADLDDLVVDLRSSSTLGNYMLAADPLAGLEAMPEVASEPPHSMPIKSSEIGKSSFCCMPAAAAISRAARTAFSMVLSVPPSS